ncbi:MAG: FtsW/RodA/SpoVE family cell cycle protein [Oscillospiraceae bacterium]|nr:FtsW/RodA/SpoVE family cell cycle protein [Oscillospiraceae bacterium]
MSKFWKAVAVYIKKSDMLLLSVAVACTLFGIVMIHSVTGSGQYIVIQAAAMVLGIGMFVLFSVVDVDIFADKSVILYIISVLFIASLMKWGVAGNSGNKAWLRFGPIGIQPAEVVKFLFIIVLAKLMITLHDRRGLNRPLSVLAMLAVFGTIFGLIVVVSADLGSALVYFFIFVVMLFTGGLSLWWFLGGAAVLAAAMPFVWNHFLDAGQKNRILAPYDPSVDPTGLGVRWQANQSTLAISSGGLAGQGLGQGKMTQAGSVPQQHTDFIFSAVGEELGFIGCAVVIILLLVLIVRCFWVARHCNYPLGMLVCSGIGAMFIAQMVENVGMCLGLTPVIGLTLPFFSYGGSSILTNYIALGIISGIKMRARAQRMSRY